MWISKIAGGVALLLCFLLVAASQSEAKVRWYKDKDQPAYRVEFHAGSRQILSGMFVSANLHALKCSDGGVLLGGFPIKRVRLRNGRFRTTSSDTIGEGGSWELTVRGKMQGDAIRGVLTFNYTYLSPKHSSECWSGKGKRDPRVHFVARTATASR
jgi:hypothetical protein